MCFAHARFPAMVGRCKVMINAELPHTRDSSSESCAGRPQRLATLPPIPLPRPTEIGDKRAKDAERGAGQGEQRLSHNLIKHGRVKSKGSESHPSFV